MYFYYLYYKKQVTIFLNNFQNTRFRNYDCVTAVTEIERFKIFIHIYMSDVNVINVEARDQPIEKVLVFSDRAEVKRLIKAELTAGVNQVHIKNVTQSLVPDSVRVDGRGDGSIHEVLVQDRHSTNEKADSPQVAELRTKFVEKEKEVNVIRDKLAIQSTRSNVLDKMVGEIGTGILPKDTNVNVNDDLLSSITKIFSFYDENASTVRGEQRETRIVLGKAEEDLNKLRNELEQAENSRRMGTYSKTVVVVLESEKGGSVELDVVYQVFNASWRPSYDLRVQSSTEHTLKISYFAQVTQNTGEDWVEVPLVLSTAQPCLGGHIPELGTLEASLYRKPEVMAYGVNGGYGGQLFGSAARSVRSCAAPQMFNSMEKRSMDHVQVSDVKEQALSTEFNITRPATIPSKPDEHKVTIGIVDLTPQLIYECVPSKNTSVFLTASSVNSSQLPFLAGPASVYLNGSFIAKTQLKTVSPGERFACSLGVDAAIRVEYKPAKKYHEQVGIINKSSSNVTEQVIKIKNTKNVPVILTVKEHLPRSTDEKIKIRLINPTSVSSEEASVSVSDGPSAPKKGCRLNGQNNLEWTVELKGGEISDLLVKYGIDHPKEEKIEFTEKY